MNIKVTIFETINMIWKLVLGLELTNNVVKDKLILPKRYLKTMDNF